MKMVTSKDNKLLEGKLIKMKSIRDSKAIEVGDSFFGHYFNKPTVGEGFIFFPTNKLGLPFQTSIVTKIVDEFTFETKNSVYYLIDKVTDRNIKIDHLIQ